MRKFTILGLAALAALAQPAAAGVIFTESFDALDQGPLGGQVDTGLIVTYAAELSGWTWSGLNALHAEDRTFEGDWAMMFYGVGGAGDPNANQMTMDTGVAANELGVLYTLAFEGAAANYQNEEQGNQDGDFVQFSIVDAADQIVASYLYDPENWSGGPSNPFSTASFTYVGTGTGDVRINIMALTTFNHFGGAIDNLELSSADVPEPATLALFGLGYAGLAIGRRRR